MTDERLAELRAWIPGLPPLPRMWASELLAEVDRLRSRVAALTPLRVDPIYLDDDIGPVAPDAFKGKSVAEMAKAMRSLPKAEECIVPDLSDEEVTS
jgi:hypothetical protein